MVGDNKGKRPKIKDITEDDGEDSDNLDTDLVLSIEKLQEFQDQLDKINEEASEEVLAVEQKHNGRRRPIYTKRDEVIKTIPDFWLTAFLSHPALGDLLSEEDAKIFKYLDSLDVEDFKDLKFGYSITFNFKPNPFFEDTKLTKTFTFFDEGTTKITGTDINWKAGKGAANGGNDAKKGNKRPASEDSFFSWFSETQQKNIVEELNDEVAEIIKEDLWPNPLKYFNNEADEEDSDGGEGEDEDEDDDEENGNHDEQDDDGEDDGDEEE